MFPPLHLPRHPASIAAAATGAVSVTVLTLWAILHKRPTPAELEQRRRAHLAANGRIVDGSLTGAHPDDHAPTVILYRYRVAGVTYERGQDVSALDPAPRDLRLDFPVQVRYDRANPGNSIVVAEDWNGLWSIGSTRQRTHDSGARVANQ